MHRLGWSTAWAKRGEDPSNAQARMPEAAPASRESPTEYTPSPDQERLAMCKATERLKEVLCDEDTESNSPQAILMIWLRTKRSFTFWTGIRGATFGFTITIRYSGFRAYTNKWCMLRVLDLGAGNGMVGEELKKHGVSRLVGVDIIKEACEATERDRPGVYDAYYVVDFCNLSEEERDEISSWSFNCLTTVAALGFGDIPPKAFMEAFNLVNDNGWIAFNIKETFLDRSDETGFSKLIRELIFSKHLELYHLERYRHRLSVEGEPLFYFALGGRKNSDVTRHFLKSVGVST
jgi:SAM-dependent methyltransferase